MNTSLRNFIARIPGLRFWVARSIFLRSRNPLRFWGVFSSQAEAKAHIPANLNAGFDDPNISDEFDESIPMLDAETVVVLSKLMPEVKTIFDLGGNIGLCFYRYRSQITYPADLRWTVCDVPFVNAAGRRIAEKRGETQLAFTDNQLDASGVDVYLTCGALQYFEESFADLLARLKEKPTHLVVNRVPMTPTETFFTLQHGDFSVVPYQIVNRDDFIASIKAIGYDLVESWQNDRVCDIILRPDYFVRHYYGFHFKKAR